LGGLIALEQWKAEWLLDEDNAEIRHVLIEQVGYEKICKELKAIDVDTWREYILMIIDGAECVGFRVALPNLRIFSFKRRSIQFQKVS
jgi:hypothetical protein